MKIMTMGDLHGEWGKANHLIQRKQPDIIFQCGDLGWWPSFSVIRSTVYHMPKWNHKGLKMSPETQFLFCDGNHEDHPDLRNIQVNQGMGRAVKLYDNVYHMRRGARYQLPDGRVVLFYGGAESIDKHLRTFGVDWFPEEIPHNNELYAVLDEDKPVDIVISHTCPEEWTPSGRHISKQNDPTRKHLSMILDKFKPSLWYHGHWHKEGEGKHGDTRWYSLDYPGHGGRWWRWL